jgi:hypothetical protein
MPNLNPRRFTDPSTLRKIKPECLLDWLTPASEYFARHGVDLPPPGSPSPINYERLAKAFMEPEADMPPYLVDSLYIIHEMADHNGMDTILETAEEKGVALDIGDEHEPADVAVQAWLTSKDMVEQLHNQHQLMRSRSFLYFATETDPIPGFTPPTLEMLEALEARLDDWYTRKKRGRGCRVFAYPKDEECWFLVRHGLPCKREGAMKDGEEAASVFYRPQKHDVLVYNSAEGEIRINCCGKRELELFRQAFGLHLFGNKEFFPGTAKYTLAPLVTDGRNSLACIDIEGIESVSLREVEILYRGRPWQRIARKSDDVFALVEAGHFRWPTNTDQLTKASFEVKYADSSKTRMVTVIPTNKAQYGRDEDSLLVERWLKARGFIGEVITDEEDEGAVAQP